MSLTRGKFQIEEKKIVVFGAGKIGRSFLGQLFGIAGYKIVFVDVYRTLVDMLNEKGQYRIVIRGEEEEEIIIKNAAAIYASDKEKVAKAVSTAGIVAVSVGTTALEKIIDPLAAGLVLRYNNDPSKPLDIIIAENMRSAGEYIKVRLIEKLPSGYPVDRLVGLIETSIGKMVPFMTSEELEKDPLLIYAEPYNTLILDKNGFRSPIPQVSGLAPMDNIRAWVDRKAFIHNLGHASAAYFGYFRNPNAIYMSDILEDTKVLEFTRNVMLQSANILAKAYPDDFTAEDLGNHTDDLIRRMANKALRDTVFRVGHDLTRKLSADDRFLGAINLATELSQPFDLILEAMSYGFFFRAKNGDGLHYPADISLLDRLELDFKNTLVNDLRLSPVTDSFIIDRLFWHYCQKRVLLI